MGELKLSTDQRLALFAGECPKITFPGERPCPVMRGHVEVLSPHVRLEVEGARRTADGDWSLIYLLHNNRLGQRFLAAQDGQLHPEQYAHSGGSAVDPEAGEAVDEFTQRRITQEARLREREAAAELLAAAEDVREAVKQRMSSPEFRKLAGREVWRLRAELDRMIDNIRNRAA